MNSILIIEDDDHIGTILSEVLLDQGCEVQYASNGKEGIKLFNGTCKFDVVITDIRMPEMDGNAVARHIRSSTESETPIVAITGFSHEADVELFDFMLVKPFSLEALFNSVELLV